MTMDDVREYEKNMHEQTNIKVCNQHSSTVDDIESHAQTSVCRIFQTCCPPCPKETHKLIFEIRKPSFPGFLQKRHSLEAVGEGAELL